MAEDSSNWNADDLLGIGEEIINLHSRLTQAAVATDDPNIRKRCTEAAEALKIAAVLVAFRPDEPLPLWTELHMNIAPFYFGWGQILPPLEVKQ